jgi:hypothetical protein
VLCEPSRNGTRPLDKPSGSVRFGFDVEFEASCRRLFLAVNRFLVVDADHGHSSLQGLLP